MLYALWVTAAEKLTTEGTLLNSNKKLFAVANYSYIYTDLWNNTSANGGVSWCIHMKILTIEMFYEQVVCFAMGDGSISLTISYLDAAMKSNPYSINIPIVYMNELSCS